MNANQHPGQVWIRKCDECNHKQQSNTPPADSQSYARYADIKCKKCKSMGLDYGKWIDEESFKQIQKLQGDK